MTNNDRNMNAITRVAPSAVWSMPLTGIGGPCVCCADIPVSESLVEEFIDNADGRHGIVTHEEMVEAARDLWARAKVCEFFDTALSMAVERVAGHVNTAYHWQTAVAAIGLFSRTWLGCPRNALDPDIIC